MEGVNQRKPEQVRGRFINYIWNRSWNENELELEFELELKLEWLKLEIGESWRAGEEKIRGPSDRGRGKPRCEMRDAGDEVQSGAALSTQ